ncbi:hypothetical protein OIU85_003338 [Salix viminalis]|uniref:Uncharacterized protein n=1 Tax=Salix viminalis TaxID=40686 RepID=A0A9Q0T0K1_SALVM|nr:hypothetical protein OIU85_003338 [Salix viminalis]
MKCYSDHPRLIPSCEGGRRFVARILAREFPGGVFLVVAMESLLDRRIFRISRFHPGALVEAVLVNFTGPKYRVDCGGGVADSVAGGIKSREGHSFEPHSLIVIGLQRLSGNRRHGVKRGGVKRGRTKKRKGTNKMRGATRGLPGEVTHP